MRVLHVKLLNKSGLHARPASIFIQTTKRHSSRIIIRKGNREADGKNVLQILSLGIDMGDEVDIIIDGEDEDVTAREVEDLIKSLPALDESHG